MTHINQHADAYGTSFHRLAYGHVSGPLTCPEADALVAALIADGHESQRIEMANGTVVVYVRDED